MKTEHNLAKLDTIAQQKLQVDMAASSVAYHEKYQQFVNLAEVSRNQPPELQSYFMERLDYYRQLSQTIGVLESIED
ncbi:DNA polymerase III subunit theta [Thorsellia anophelis]|uniref:DNA polymerase-3 subunit theta n=1 Tax=Thorsellia anophelis DSM 18579 TaxID=1123402 RepID=A0A1H9ZZU6_9GAMM|nr:DNA polymerase III subunit theta [Thorsellia anophelis]SES86910.1 DNA polymerase-3 subunit theta [Thorsellia anophelis DSM 18579]